VDLRHLEEDRGNSPRTRNARLGAIHSFSRFATLEHPEHAHTIARVMAIPTKRYERNTVNYLDREEIDALVMAPDKRLSSPFGGDSSVRKRDLDAGAAEVDHRDQGVGGVESVGAV